MSEQKMTGYPSIDKPWLKYYSEEAKNNKYNGSTVYQYLYENNKNHLNDIAIQYFGTSISYGEMFEKISVVEKCLKQLGVKKGEIVSLFTVNTPETICLFYAISKIGAVADIVDPRFSKEEIGLLLKNNNSKYCFILEPLVPLFENVSKEHENLKIVYISPKDSLNGIEKVVYGLKNNTKKSIDFLSWEQFFNLNKHSDGIIDKDVETAANDVVLMTHTSGTTGKSKGVMLTNNNINAVAFQYKWGMPHERKQKYLAIIPPFIAFGVCVAIHLPLALGMTCIILPQFDVNKFGKYLSKYKPNHFTCTPSNLDTLALDNKKIDLSYLIVPSVGGDYISAKQEKRINRYLSDCGCKYELVKGYGMTEVSSSACTTMNNHNKYESVGFPLLNMTISIFKPETDVELKYGEEGEICFCGPNVMDAYYKVEQATSKIKRLHSDGNVWIHSGDIGYMDEDGFLYVHDRIKRIIHLSNGVDLLPSKVERVVNEHPAVENCALVKNIEINGEVTSKLYVVRKKDVEKMELSELCKESISEQMCPAYIEFIDNIPLTPVGKIDYRKLEEMAQNDMY